MNPDSFAPESRERLMSFLQRDGQRYLVQAGEFKLLALLLDTDSGGIHVRRYRTVFADGLGIILTVRLPSAGATVSLDPRPE